jgi:hypothetical protein
MKSNMRFIKILLGCCFVACALQGKAQAVLAPNVDFVVPSIHFWTNDCLGYYNNPDSTSQVFKSVTETHWFSSDSNLAHKRFSSKKKTVFNKLGQTVFSVNLDTLGVADSERHVYDAQYNEIKEIDYMRGDSDLKIRKMYEEIWVYDAKNNVLKDSVIDSGNGRPGNRYRYYDDFDGEGGSMRAETKVSYYTYDTAGNQLGELTIRIGDSYADTTRVHQKYDGHKRQVYKEDFSGNWRNRLYTTYDDSGNVTSLIDTTATGSVSANYYTYNNRNEETSHSEFSEGKQISNRTMQYDFNGTHILTEDETPIVYGNNCPNNSRKVTIYDTGGRILSEITTSQKNGKPFINSIRHGFAFSNGRVVVDSTITVIKGYLYSSSSTTIETTEYDKHGNETEMISEGGGQYVENGSERWKYNDKNKLLEDDKYNSCNSDIPESSVRNIYYPGGLNIKETITDSYGGGDKSINYFFEDSKKKEELMIGGSVDQTIYEYEKW